ncbi:MAG TPA: chemotaxis protein CheB, partial [Candidatus Sulfotelmatobacter sp.]|nr:chemotaxis protein CheB [Candidatus Sulfotelmatobacter sp.]
RGREDHYAWGQANSRMARKPKQSSTKLPYASRNFDVVAMGASAGGLNALIQVLRVLPASFPSSIVVVQHLAPMHKSWIADLLGRSTPLTVKQAEHGEILLPATIYTAPPDEHLLVGPGKIQLAHTQLVHFSRPSIDLLFESVAGTYGSRSIGVVLSGSGKDGAEGMRTIKESGGTTIVQMPETAEFRPMPEAAIQTGCADFVLRLEKIGEKLSELCCGQTSRNG